MFGRSSNLVLNLVNGLNKSIIPVKKKFSLTLQGIKSSSILELATSNFNIKG